MPAPLLQSASSGAVPAPRTWPRLRVRSLRSPRPELIGLIALAAVLDLWALSRNGWANEYYSAAVRSMSTSWHAFLYASLDSSGVMTVDKPPLSLWVQALSVRAFGFHPLSILVPQALMGVASVALVYDLVRRRFGRLGGFVAGLALALTPMTVAISRHNNPDALLVLCCVAALWFAIRALEDGSTRKLVLAGVCVGLGFETKMGVALAVVPGIAAAWLAVAPAGRGRLHALRQLLGAGAAMVVVAGAWPALVELTPAADRPWVSGTSDNRILSLIFGYNGLGRVDGQTGGPGGGPGGGSFFGGSPGPFRLLNSALGGQAGWLLGFALAGGLVLLASTRLRRADPRSGWLLAVGGAFAATAVLFSAASGIFHPYYVSLLAPFTAALVGAGAVELLSGRRLARLAASGVLLAAAACELVVLSRYPGELGWLSPLLIAFSILAAAALLLGSGRRLRGAALATALAVLLIAPGAWAFDTLGHSANGTFPAGGPASAAGGPGGFGAGLRGGPALGLSGPGAAARLFGPGAGGEPGAGAPGAGAIPGGAFGRPPGAGFGPGPGAAGGAGSPFGASDSTLTHAISYVRAHGGGTIAVSSQSSAAQAIVSQGARVAGIGGFSGRESKVSVSWLAAAVRAGRIRWVLDTEGRTGGFPGLPGDTRTGARTAMAVAARACTPVSLGSSPTFVSRAGGRGGSQQMTLYDCAGRASALERIG